jgi:hypothetical protein
MVGTVCGGVPNDAVCEEDYCTEGVECAQVFQVDSGAAFNDAVAGATPGTCIALAPGNYGSVALPIGVSLLGKGADLVTVASIESRGIGVRIRGLTVDGGSISVSEGDTTIDAVRIIGSPGDGVAVGSAASVTVTRSEITSAGRYHLSAFNSASVTVDASIIDGKGLGGPGMWVECDQDSGCVLGSATLSMTNSKVKSTKLVGVSLVGAVASFDNVEVRDTHVGDNFEAGGGISASACSSVTATGLSVMDNVDFGMLLDDSALDADGLTVSRNLRGLWIQYVGMTCPAEAVVRNAVVSGNQGVGIGVAAASTGVRIEQSRIENTVNVALPVLVGGISSSSDLVGDGFNWQDASFVSLDGVSISGSDRASMLIDGVVAAGSTIANVVLSAGDESLGIKQQNLPTDGVQPAVVQSPPVQAFSEELFSIPEEVGIPPTI